MRALRPCWLLLLILENCLASAQTPITTVATGTYPVALAVNSVTNKIYVVNQGSNTVSIIDGITNTAATIAVGSYPTAAAVNPVTNKIYVGNYSGHSVTVIDGATNRTATIAVAPSPKAVAVNSVTNKIYVSNMQNNSVTVIDGATNATSTVSTGPSPGAVAVNSDTNQVFVANTGNGTMTVIDAAHNNQTSQVTVGSNPIAIAVSIPTNKVYVANQYPSGGNGSVTVWDGASNTTSTITAGLYPSAVAVNPATDTIYVANAGDGTMTILDGAGQTTTTVAVGSYPSAVAVNPITNKVYVANCIWYATATMLDGLTLATSTVDTGVYSGAVAVNPQTNMVYVANLSTNNVTVIAGAASPAMQFVPVSPCRVADTRLQNGPLGGPPLAPGSTRSFPIPSGGCGIPTTATAYSVNLTVVPHGVLNYLTAWPTGEDQPLVSTLNSLDGRIKANAAIIPSGAAGAISMFASGTTDAVVDINGYFVPTAVTPGLAFYPLPPCRMVDTRGADGPFGGPHLKHQHERDFPLLASACALPSNAVAYAMNVTAMPRGSLGYLTVWPTGLTQPLVSTLNAPTGAITANAAIIPTGDDGGIAVYPSDDTDLVLDVDGYFASPGDGGLSFYTLMPWRALDTRRSGGGFSGALRINVAGNSWGIPAEAQAFAVNATVVPYGSLGYLTLWADGSQQPLASTLNAMDGSITSNMALVPTSNGWIDAYAAGMTNLVVDVSGYFAP